MPAKKKDGKKKKKKKEDLEPDLTEEEKLIFLTRQVESTKHQLIMAENKACSAEAVVRELRNRLFDLHKDYETERKRTFDIAADMTRQYKSMRQQMQSKIETLEKGLLEKDDQLVQSRKDQSELEQEKDAIIHRKNEEIEEHIATMDKMSYDFSQMLKRTLEKMANKVVISNDWEAEGQTGPVVRSFEDLSA
jgi:uncharacterized protein involved in exopolysaccharide biosynthesis